MQQKMAQRHHLLYRHSTLIYAPQGEAWVSHNGAANAELEFLTHNDLRKDTT